MSFFGSLIARSKVVLTNASNPVERSDPDTRLVPSALSVSFDVLPASTRSMRLSAEVVYIMFVSWSSFGFSFTVVLKESFKDISSELWWAPM